MSWSVYAISTVRRWIEDIQGLNSRAKRLPIPSDLDCLVDVITMYGTDTPQEAISLSAMTAVGWVFTFTAIGTGPYLTVPGIHGPRHPLHLPAPHRHRWQLVRGLRRAPLRS